MREKIGKDVVRDDSHVALDLVTEDESGGDGGLVLTASTRLSPRRSRRGALSSSHCEGCDLARSL